MKLKFIYTPQDRKLANDILGTVNYCTVPENWVKWANHCLAFFNRIQNLTKTYVGHYFCRLSLAWRQVKAEYKKHLARIKRAYKGLTSLGGELFLPCIGKIQDVPTFKLKSSMSKLAFNQSRLERTR